jgi:N6-adenosine-specific RNA methylase IME4
MKKYQIIYADPPWSYDFGKSSSRFIEQQYETMSKEQLFALPIKDIAEKDSLLLMWVTFPKLMLAIPVMEAWGFSYRTMLFTWVKKYSNGKNFMGCGYYTRSNPEILLLGKRGKGLKTLSHSINSVLEYPIMRHSKKPPIVRKYIVDLFGDVPRIELFARKEKELIETEYFEGWDVFGNEVEGSIELEKRLE